MKRCAKILMSLSFVGTLAACGQADDQASNLATSPVAKVANYETVLFQAGSRPTNGGFNPDARAVEIRGKVQLGTNGCHAEGKTAKLVAKRVGKNIEVAAVITSVSMDPFKFCTAEYMPVTVPVKLVVRSMASETESIIVKNVNKMNNNVDANLISIAR